ncbi:hypothetical protein ACQZ44_11830 [Agrobacterium vitis]
MKIEDSEGGTPDGITVNLVDYSPVTVNTAVQTTASSAQTNGTNSATSSTTGNSYAQSSTYGVSVTAGMNSGETASYEYSTTHTRENSNTASLGTSSDKEASSGESMSIKDWGSYALVSPTTGLPTWIFGQEYPWNSIECRFGDTGEYNENNSSQIAMQISATMASNLYDGSFLYPPSELSMYGINFVMKSCWRLYVDYGASTTINIENDLKYYSASHYLEGDGPVVYMDTQAANIYAKNQTSDATVSPSITTTLDLNIMGLDPIGVNSRAAIVGFIPTRFIPQAISSQVTKGFRTLATTNDLMIDDTTEYPDGSTSGFTTSQTCLTMEWSSSQSFAYQLTLYFKIIDTVNEYTLYLKHWKTNNTGVVLSIIINGDNDNVIRKYVDATEAEGGEDNMLSIALRNLDFSSVEYHDYLQLGLNSVSITAQPMDDAWDDSGYQIRAISVEKR